MHNHTEDQDQQDQEQDPTQRYSSDALEHALGRWRDSWRQAHRLSLPAVWQQDYDRAAQAAAIAGLHDCHSMQDLLQRYEHRDHVMDPVIQGAAQDAAKQGHLLNRGLAEDSAFWLRYCQLVGRAVDSRAGEQEGQQ